jgi:hypothetical protein
MTLHTAILINVSLDLALIVALAATMLIPFTLDRHKNEGAVYAFAAPLSEELAA